MKEDFKKIVGQSWFDFYMTGLPSDAIEFSKKMRELESARKKENEIEGQ